MKQVQIRPAWAARWVSISPGIDDSQIDHRIASGSDPELVHDGKNVVVVTMTASAETPLPESDLEHDTAISMTGVDQRMRLRGLRQGEHRANFRSLQLAGIEQSECNRAAFR